MKDYSMYKYYKGLNDYPNKKSAFFGFYEMGFENNFKGKPEDKEEEFKKYIRDLLYEQASDIYMFGEIGVDKDKSFNEYLDIYINPELHLGRYE